MGDLSVQNEKKNAQVQNLRVISQNRFLQQLPSLFINAIYHLVTHFQHHINRFSLVLPIFLFLIRLFAPPPFWFLTYTALNSVPLFLSLHWWRDFIISPRRLHAKWLYYVILLQERGGGLPILTLCTPHRRHGGSCDGLDRLVSEDICCRIAPFPFISF